MVEIINLRQQRKLRKRADEARQASDNRALHGLSKSRKQDAKRAAKSSAQKLDGKKLDPKS